MDAVVAFQTDYADGFEAAFFTDASRDAYFEAPEGPWSGLGLQLAARLAPADGSRRALRAAAPMCDSVQLVTFRADVADQVVPVLEPFGEFLPVSTPEGDLVAFHCLNVVDALDVEGSAEIEWADPVRKDRILFFSGLALREDVAGGAGGAGVFVLPQLRRSSPFISAAVVEALRATSCGLEGTDFRPPC